MSRRRAVIAAVGATALIALVLVVVTASGGDDQPATTSAAPAEAPSAPPSGDLGALPPGFVECMAEQGYEIQSSADIHAAPQDVLQTCFGAAH